MQNTSMKKFLKALNDAEIKYWEAVTDIPTHLYNNANQFNLVDYEEDILYNFSSAIGSVSPYTGEVVVKGADLADIHEVRFSGSIEDVKKFIEKYGLNATEDNFRILANIQGANFNLKPLTGDYFRVLTEEEISKLTPTEKEIYEAELKERNKMQRAVQVKI